MKRTSFLIAVVTCVSTLILAISHKGYCMDEPGFGIGRMVLSEEVVNREPVGEAVTFSAATEKVYCFLEATNIEWDMDVVFVWYHENTELAKIALPIKQGPRWRTQSSKKVEGLKGSWRVELQESSGIVLNTVFFTVE